MEGRNLGLIEIPSSHLLGGTEENTKHCQDRLSGTRFEPDINREDGDRLSEIMNELDAHTACLPKRPLSVQSP
jgi:hypothetical protein